MNEPVKLVPGPHPGVTRTIAVPAGPTAFGFGGGRAALGYDDGRLRVVDLATGAMLIDVASDVAPVCAVALAGRWLVAAVDDRIEVWDTLTATRLVVHPPHPDRIVAIAVEPESKWVATIDHASPGVRVADLRTGVEQARIGRIAARIEPNPEPPPEEFERELRTALAAFAAFRIMHADAGAADDEIERELHRLIRDAWLGADAGPRPRLPLGVAGWRLMDGATVAAERLDGAAVLVDAAVRGIPPHERDRMRPFVAAEAWRADLDATDEDIGCHAIGWLMPDGADAGHLVIEHDDVVGIWDVLVPERVAELPGTLLGVGTDTVLVVDPVSAEIRSWQVFAGTVRSQPLPPGRLVPTIGAVDEVLIVDDALLSVVGFGRPTVRIPAGIGRLGTLIARVDDDVIAASRATLRVCPFAALEVDDPRAGLPIHALAVHPDGAFVGVLRVLDDHDEMRVERWTPGESQLQVLPGAVSLAETVGIGPSGRIWAGGAIVRVWGPGGAEEALDATWRSARVVGRWAHAGNRLLDLETGEVRPAPPVSADRLAIAAGEYVVAVGEDGIEVLAADGVTVVHRELFVPGSTFPVGVHALRDGGVLLLLADGGAAGWSPGTGLVRPWNRPSVVSAAVTGDGRVVFGVIDPDASTNGPRGSVELWDGALADPVRLATWPASGAGVVVAAAGSFVAYGDPTGQLGLIDLREA